LPIAHHRVAQSDFPARRAVESLPAMSLPALGRPAPDVPSVLRADLHLRFGETRLAGQVHWPVRPGLDAKPPLMLLLDGARGSTLAVDLCRTAPAIVVHVSLAVGRGRASTLGAGMAALGWTADHAEELGCAAGELVVAGLAQGGAHAAWLAITARAEGWPPLRRQLLVHPCFDAVFPLPPHPARVAPATVITGPRTRDAGRAYAALLRRHGTEVRELTDLGESLDAAGLLDPFPHPQTGGS
jgi:alpha/beta hydrolase family protein